MPPPILRAPRGPQGPGGMVPGFAQQALLRKAKRRQAESAIAGRWTRCGGTPGAATVPGDDGLIGVGAGFYREYEKGRIYFRFGHQPVHVYGAIGEKYAQIGGPQSWLGWPTASPAPRRNDDFGPVIDPQTLPDEQPFSEDGRVSTFERGAIYWWADTGAIELGQISLRYTGLVCFSETDGAGSDEPYVLLGTIPAPPTAPAETRSVIYEDVDSGESREDDIELYRGLPYGLTLTITLMEHDSGDPDKYRDTVKVSVDQASTAVGHGVGAIPYVGPFLAPVAKAFLQAVGPEIVDAVNGLLGTDDDFVGSASLFVSGKNMVTMAKAQPNNFRGVLWHMDSPLISGDGADYKVYIGIWAV